jgi:hypothetical protein
MSRDAVSQAAAGDLAHRASLGIILTPKLRDLSEVLRLAADAEDLHDRGAGWLLVDRGHIGYVLGIRDALSWAAGIADEPDLPAEKCEGCRGRGGWEHPQRGDEECDQCDGAGVGGVSADRYPTFPTGAQRIALERRRQIVDEGWTPEHDAGHAADDLAIAAVCYALPSEERCPEGILSAHIFDVWPWEPRSWKPCPDDRVRELVKAGALIAAEIDRLQARGGAER